MGRKGKVAGGIYEEEDHEGLSQRLCIGQKIQHKEFYYIQGCLSSVGSLQAIACKEHFVEKPALKPNCFLQRILFPEILLDQILNT